MADTQTATAIMEHGSKSRLAYALVRLLDSLRPFMRAYPRAEDDHMPEHDLVWVEFLDNENPKKVIADAIKAYPELWLHALPEEVCIVPRKELNRAVGLGPGDVILSSIGESIVANHAHRHRVKLENI